MEFQGQLKKTFIASQKQSMPYDKIRLAKRNINKVNKTFGRKPDKETFWLLLWLWTKVTRSAERKKGREYKAFEWSMNYASG
tara:strand:- start:1369 stop:1614 length:246 start_codon:yes stop_codon:yes gene_type:complete